MDWIGGNLYWAELYLSSSKPRGRIVVSKLDGRYRHSVISSDLEMPISVVVDPERGMLLWSDVGSNMRIESAYMDGKRRRTLTNGRHGLPVSLVIDFAMNHTVFWADPKLNTIEMMNIDGSMRRTVISGCRPRVISCLIIAVYISSTCCRASICGRIRILDVLGY